MDYLTENRKNFRLAQCCSNCKHSLYDSYDGITVCVLEPRESGSSRDLGEIQKWYRGRGMRQEYICDDFLMEE